MISQLIVIIKYVTKIDITVSFTCLLFLYQFNILSCWAENSNKPQVPSKCSNQCKDAFNPVNFHSKWIKGGESEEDSIADLLYMATSNNNSETIDASSLSDKYITGTPSSGGSSVAEGAEQLKGVCSIAATKNQQFQEIFGNLQKVWPFVQTGWQVLLEQAGETNPDCIARSYYLAAQKVVILSGILLNIGAIAYNISGQLKVYKNWAQCLKCKGENNEGLDDRMFLKWLLDINESGRCL